MPKKIVILNGSPRRKGNTAALVKAFTNGAESAGHTVTEFFLDGMSIHGCKGCFGGHSKASALLMAAEVSIQSGYCQLALKFRDMVPPHIGQRPKVRIFFMRRARNLHRPFLANFSSAPCPIGFHPSLRGNIGPPSRTTAVRVGLYPLRWWGFFHTPSSFG